MRQFSFKLPIYDWTLTFITVLDKTDASPIEEYINTYMPKLPQSTKESIINAVANEYFNGGETLTSMSGKKAIIIIFRWSEESYFYNVLNHEKRHCIDNIMEDCHIPDKEAAAYLDGYISAELHKQIHLLT